jgi:hypothetical protein
MSCRLPKIEPGASKIRRSANHPTVIIDSMFCTPQIRYRLFLAWSQSSTVRNKRLANPRIWPCAWFTMRSKVVQHFATSTQNTCKCVSNISSCSLNQTKLKSHVGFRVYFTILLPSLFPCLTAWYRQSQTAVPWVHRDILRTRTYVTWVRPLSCSLH